MGSLRITGGVLKGRRVEVPSGDFEIRPAMDRMRESLFSILGALDGRSFLDLFSGSGVIGLEAASRGASPVECVERDRGKRALLIRNVSMASERIEVHCVPVERFVARAERRYDIIFADPPFPYAFKSELVAAIAEKRLLQPGGTLLLHFPAEEEPVKEAGGLSAVDEREYGRSRVRFYKAAEGCEAPGAEIP